MTNDEIKKLYTKTKRAYEKRTGEKYTWVMNAKQQTLGTATICTGCTSNYELFIQQLNEYIDGGETARMATKTWKSIRKESLEEERTGGASWDPYFWRSRFEKMGTLDEYIAEQIEKDRKAIADYQVEIDQGGDMAARILKDREHAKAMIYSPEIQSFLAAVDGSAEIEVKRELNSVTTYIRFHY